MGKDTIISERFTRYDRGRIDALVSTRKGETKLGERVGIAMWETIKKSLDDSPATFVLVGIPEDIGVRANGGVGGAHTLWEPSLKALLNIQATSSFSGDELLVLGAFDFKDWMNGTLDSEVAVLRSFVAWIDEAVHPLISAIVSAGKIPVVIGGGHNNAFPLLKGSAAALGRKLNCINLDAHSDYRIMEGRHSGNGFRYAKAEGYLDKYAMIGLHKNYNSQAVMDEIAANEDLDYSYFDDLMPGHDFLFRDAVNQALHFTDQGPAGIELDMDCIEGVLASAATPSGITALQARQYVTWCAKEAQAAYLHITEGATVLRNGRSDAGTAKLVAYLISDFIRAAKGSK